jgi:hypothetical protein
MNNTKNNGGATVVLLLIICTISLMMSSSSALLGFNLLTTIGPSKEVTSYVKTQDERIEQLGKQAGIDGKQLKQDVIDGAKKACLVSVDTKGACPKGMRPSSDGCCTFEDPKAQSSLDILADMAPDLAIGIIGGAMVESLIIAGINTKLFTQTAVKGTTTAVVAGTRTATATAATTGSATAARAGSQMSVRLAAQAAPKVATTLGTQFSAALACGPLCIAVTVALTVFTIALDLTDPFGYNNFTANKVIRSKRNTLDTMLQESLVKKNMSYPMTFPLAAAFPEFNKEIEEKMLVEFLPDALELMPKDLMVRFFTSMLKGEEVNDTEVTTAFGKAMDQALANTKKRDAFVYDFYAAKGKKNDIEKVPFMSTKDRVGVTLSEEGAKKYNERMKEKHLKYSNPHTKPPNDIPKEYTPMVAMYTDTYRVLNTTNPGKKNSPNVEERKLPKKICMAMPYGSLIADCEYGFRATKHSQRLNPATYGVRFSYDRGDCDFTKEYCTRLGMKIKGNECVLPPGQKEAELILGKTITRVYTEDWNNRIDAWNSGDAGSIALATLTLPFALSMPWIMKGVQAIKDTYGRGVGTPMICGPDKERKGALCYPECREGYKSSALECEGECPDGSRNTGLTCLQPIHAFIPGNKCSNPFRGCFYQRKSCNRRVDPNSDLGKALIEAGQSLDYKYRGTTCNEPCYPGFTFRSGAAGSAFCDKPRSRYSRAGKATVPNKCPEGKKEDHALCYKPCKEGYRGQGPTCKKSEESRRGNIYKGEI